MYLAIDVGGTKTLLALFSTDGRLVVRHKFHTNKNYADFIKELDETIATEIGHHRITACACALPARIDRSKGVGLAFGNLDWKNVPVLDNIKKVLPGRQVYIENDAKLAGLSEAVLIQKKYKRVLYLTLSTGIGGGFITNGKIDADLADSEPGQMVLEYNGQLQKWEDFASGRALFKRYGKKASEINDPVIWEAYARGVSRGLNELLATLQPDVVVIGGSVGSHFEKFGDLLVSELKTMENDMVKVPPILKAQRPQEAVIYGCYELIRQTRK